MELRQQATQAATRLKRLYEAVEDGLASTDDQDLKDRMRELAIIRGDARADAEPSLSFFAIMACVSWRVVRSFCG